MQHYEGQSVQGPDVDAPPDFSMRDMLTGQLHEAAERTTFHRTEAERWERVGWAAGAALVQLDSQAPVQPVEPDDLVAYSRPTQAGGMQPRSMSEHEAKALGRS